MTATLLQGTTEVDTTTYTVTVTPPPPSVEFNDLASSIVEGANDPFVINASHLDTDNAHTIRLTTDNANMGFNSTCTDRQEDFTVSRGSATYVNSRRLLQVHPRGHLGDPRRREPRHGRGRGQALLGCQPRRAGVRLRLASRRVGKLSGLVVVPCPGQQESPHTRRHARSRNARAAASEGHLIESPSLVQLKLWA